MIVVVIREFQPGGRLIRHRTYSEVRIEEPVEGPRVVLVFYEGRPQSILHLLALPEACVLQGVESVDALGGGDPQMVVPQDPYEAVYHRVHARPCAALVGMLVDGAMHLVHPFGRILTGRYFLAEVLAFFSNHAEVVEHLLRVAVVLGDHADRALYQVFAEVGGAEHNEGLRPVERLTDAWGLAEVEGAEVLDRTHQLLG